MTLCSEWDQLDSNVSGPPHEDPPPGQASHENFLGFTKASCHGLLLQDRRMVFEPTAMETGTWLLGEAAPAFR